MYRQTYAKINMNSIYNNIVKIKENYNYEYYMAVIKSNCYGHGIGSIQAIIDAGCNYLAVATLEEAGQARLYTDMPILCLGTVPVESLPICVNNNITISINSYDYYNKIKDLSYPLTVHIKLNTGMNRLGIKRQEELDEVVGSIPRTTYKLEGIFSHIYNPSNVSDTKRQFDKFSELCSNIDLNKIKIVHIAASDALTKYPKPNYINCVRLGIIMYGFSDDLDLESTFSLHSQVVQLNDLEPGDKLGYGGTYIAEKQERIAVVQIGYGDGLLRAYKGNNVYINNKPYKIIGNVCMDMLFTQADDTVNVGNTATLLKDNNHIKEIANNLNTITYEIICTVGSRVPRIYEYDNNR